MSHHRDGDWMPQEPRRQLTDSLLAEFLPRIQAAPQACRDDLRAALALAVSRHDEALLSSTIRPGDRDADLRRVGLVWATARHPLDPLLDLMTTLTERMFDHGGGASEAVVIETGEQVIRAILTGFQQAYRWSPTKKDESHDRRQLATALLWDLDVAPAHRPLLAESYAVIALPHIEQAGWEHDEEHLVGPFEETGLSGTLPFLAEPLSYVLVPAPDKRRATELATTLHRQLPEPTLLAVAWRHWAQVQSGRRETRDITRIVTVSGRPPGVYQLDDVLVEYAVLHEPSVAGRLARILAPLDDQPMLLTTLRSFIAANGNRSRTAADLDIHRSTLDYRLQRIEQLTGTGPTSAGGLQLLSIALTTYTALHAETSWHDRPA